LIDLHLHTTASDGTLAPGALVARAVAAGITILSVTDHDTVAGLAEAHAAAGAHAVRLIDGIEITAVQDARDVHMLAYFFDRDSAALLDFLAAQRADRVRRVTEIAARLADLGAAVDVTTLLEIARRQPGRSIGRPQIAEALVFRGHAVDRDDAFDRLLGDECPAYVPRKGASPGDVIALVHAAGGIVSLAHPGLLRRDDIIPRLAAEGLDAIEVRHSDHDAEAEAYYRTMAASLGVAVSGGSDYHGDSAHRSATIGEVTLPAPDFEALEELRP
jgi:predicted metal-dependent phosphoesterase TrpH